MSVTTPPTRKWPDDEINALRGRNITLIEPPWCLNLYGEVRKARHDDGAEYVVRSIPKDTTEAVTLQKVLSIPALRRYVIPGELVECTDTYVFIMPQLRTLDTLGPGGPISLDAFLEQLATIMDGLRLMHENNIAFVDISTRNFVMSYHGFHHGQYDIAPGSIYYIDFGAARLLPSGPGSGVIITDWEENGGTWPPPEGALMLDPYAYDMYSLGLTFDSMYWKLNKCSPALRKFTFEPSVCFLHFGDWMSNDEPKKRPSIWKARRRFSALRIWMKSTQWLYMYLRKTWADAVTGFGWKFMSAFIL